MLPEEFEQVVAAEFEHAIPEKFRGHIKNVAFLIEDEPSEDVRRTEGLGPGETLLGYYRGVPYPQRGDWYGMGTTMPDTITLYRLPILRAAMQDGVSVGQMVRETIWHEVAHHFGMDEETVRKREDERDIL